MGFPLIQGARGQHKSAARTCVKNGWHRLISDSKHRNEDRMEICGHRCVSAAKATGSAQGCDDLGFRTRVGRGGDRDLG